ncbi:chorismate mutase [Desulfovibrio cuneatus]|uniref:chorismate mutase n=1 Tax=Desulfovibrio cuneatus TaxID=159728 RepID=UPI00042759CB|nr:chorismate mutase [Desulfovibrio cuneatus]
MTFKAPACPQPDSANSRLEAELAVLRQQLDTIDTELVDLLCRRAAISHAVGAAKQGKIDSVFRPQREAALLERVAALGHLNMPPQQVQAIYREILSASRATQQQEHVACAGQPGSPAHLAALAIFGSQPCYAHSGPSQKALAPLASGACHAAVVPAPNPGTLAGAQFLKALARSGCKCIACTHHKGAAFWVLARETESLAPGCTLFILLKHNATTQPHAHSQAWHSALATALAQAGLPVQQCTPLAKKQTKNTATTMLLEVNCLPREIFCSQQCLHTLEAVLAPFCSTYTLLGWCPTLGEQ